MIINKSRVFNISPYIRHIKDGSKIVIGISEPQTSISKLKRIGFSEPYQNGNSILPAIVGSVTKYNAEGKEIAHKDQPKETRYRQLLWHWTEWRGRYDTVERSRIVDVPYKRYPRSFIDPPAIEFTFTKSKDGRTLLTAPVIEKAEGNLELLKHMVNLFLEIFGECEFFTEDLEGIIKTPIKRLNWIIFPQGEMPWEQLKKEVDPLIKSAPKGNQVLLYHRLKTVNDLKPDFRAIGSGGFHGYVVHGFTKRNVYILESMYYGNATYVFGSTWEELSQRTKAEILNASLQKARIIHSSGWTSKIKGVLK